MLSAMEAIKSVENEVDKVLRLFSDCRNTCNNKIDKLIELINESRHEINKLGGDADQSAELNTQQANIIQKICDKILESSGQITVSHRELHVPVSKIGKYIDKNFRADFACVSDTNLFQDPTNNKLLNLAIVRHFLRYGMTNIAEELIKEANLTLERKELVKYDEVDGILSSLRRRDVGPALDWAIKNRKRLREMNSALEFKIHRINIIELYRQGISKQFEIIQYARGNLQHLDPIYNLEIQHLMGAITYLKTGIENSPYKFLMDPINYNEIEDIFVNNACALLNLSIRSPISVAVEAGCVALPVLLDFNQQLSNQGVKNVWELRDELPVEIKLDRKFHFHSTFSCPILKQQSTESNPPMKLLCGHVISHDALQKLSGSSNAKLKCPYCPVEQVASDATRIYF